MGPTRTSFFFMIACSPASATSSSLSLPRLGLLFNRLLADSKALLGASCSVLSTPTPPSHSTICQPDDSHAFGRTFGGRPAREATDRRAQREPPWRQKFKLPPLRAERRRYLALVWENYGTRPTRCSRHPGDIPVGLDPWLSMSKKNNGRNPAVNTADTELRCRTPWLNCSSVFAERNFIATISSATTTTP